MTLKLKLEEITKSYKNLNCNDDLYEKLEKLEVELEENLIKNIHRMYYKNYSDFKKKLGYLKEYYSSKDTFYVFLNNIFEEFENGIDDVLRAINILAAQYLKQIINNKKNYSVSYDLSNEDIVHAFFIVVFLRAYKGFLFEDIVKEILTINELFIVEENVKLDNENKIDFIVSLNHIGYENFKIGLQIKSHTFLKLSKFNMSKKNCRVQHGLAIKNKLCNNIYFILHNNLNFIRIKKTGNCVIESNKITGKSILLETEIMDDLEENLIMALFRKIFFSNNVKSTFLGFRKMVLKEKMLI